MPPPVIKYNLSELNKITLWNLLNFEEIDVQSVH